MELTQAIRADFVPTRDVGSLRSNTTPNVTESENTQKLTGDRIELNSTSKTGFNLTLSHSISKVSKIQSSVESINNSLQSIESFKNLITANSGNLNNIQSQIQSQITSYNTSNQNLSSNIESIMQERHNEDSRIYFDGILGSKPISGEEIFEAISQQKQKLEQFNKQLTRELQNEMENVKQTFEVEKSNSTYSQAMVKTVDFSQESKSFEATNIKLYNGSMESVQAHSTPQVTTELLAI